MKRILLLLLHKTVAFWLFLFVCLVATPTFWIVSLSPAKGGSMMPQNALIPNGEVTAMAVGPDGTTYLGGSFTRIGPNMGFGIPISLSTGAAVPTFPIVNDLVNATAADGSGGWYIGGKFTQVGTYTRNGLAHILSDGTVDPAWDPNANGTVNAIAVSGTTVYAGGDFTTIGGTTRNKLAAIGTDGTLQSWNPSTGSTVYAIAVSGTTVYVGGAFTSIGGTLRNRLAAIGTDGTLLPWNPNVVGSVYAIAVSGTTVYVGGAFTSIGGTLRNRLAAIGTDGVLQSWNPIPNGNQVWAIAVSGTTVYVGGSFTNMNSSTRQGAAAIGTDGTLQSWNPNPVDAGGRGGYVYSIVISGTTVYLGGDFATVGGASRNNLAAIGTNGVALAWNPNAGGSVKALAISGASIYAGGSLYFLGGTARNRLAAIGTDGTLQSWNPNADNTVRAIVVSGTTVYVGGGFSSIGGTARKNLAAIGTDGTLQSWDPNANGTVWTIAVSGTTVYVGGAFTTIGGTARKNLAAIGTDGTLQSWDPNASNYVYAIAVSGTTVYVGGAFTTMSSSTRNRAAAIGTDGTLQSWDPNVGGTYVQALAISGSTIYLGGLFNTIGGVARNAVAAVGADGTLQSWNPILSTGTGVNALAISGSSVYMGGSFRTINGTTRKCVAEVSTDGTLLPWDANIQYVPGLTSSNVVNALAISGTTLSVGGLYNFYSGQSQPNFSQYDITPNPTPTIGSLSPTSAIVGSATSTLTVDGTGFVSDSVVQWDGSSRTTSFISSSQISASIPSSDFTTAGTADVTVFNPTPGGGTSTAQIFTVQYPAPTLDSISPVSAAAGSASTTLTVQGSGFIASSVVQWNGTSRVTTFVSSTLMTASIPSSDFTTAGTADVTVFNPTPGGGTSTAQGFAIIASGGGKTPSPLINATVTPNPSALPSGPGSVTYTYTLKNPTNVTLTDITLTDTACSDVIYVSGDINGDAWLEDKETWTYVCTTTLTQTTVNYATARGLGNGMAAVDTAIAQVVVGVAEVIVGVPVIPPLINIVKTSSPLTLPSSGGSVVYSYAVTNPGITDVTNVAVTDGACRPATYVSGDLNEDQELQPTEMWLYTCATSALLTTTNAVIATGQGNGLTAIDTALATLVVAGSPLPPPLIHIIKKADSVILPAGGGWVTYTYAVTNPGIIPLSTVLVTDDQCPNVTHESGDTDGDAILDMDETWTYICKKYISRTTTNTATANGMGNGLTAEDIAVASVIVSPALLPPAPTPIPTPTPPPVPKLPNTGFTLPEWSIFGIVVVAGIFVAATLLFAVTRRKHRS